MSVPPSSLPYDVVRLAETGHGIRRMFIRNLILACAIGVYQSEYGRMQRVRLNVDLGVWESGPFAGNHVEDVVCYDALAKKIRSMAGAGHIKLVETLAERVAALCLDDPRIRSARVRVEKLDVMDDAEAAGVEIERLSLLPPP